MILFLPISSYSVLPLTCELRAELKLSFDLQFVAETRFRMVQNIRIQLLILALDSEVCRPPTNLKRLSDIVNINAVFLLLIR
jgi:hypothetical protein